VDAYSRRNKDWKFIREYMEENQRLGNMVHQSLIKTDYGVSSLKMTGFISI
jgi:hypothetical protein